MNGFSGQTYTYIDKSSITDEELLSMVNEEIKRWKLNRKNIMVTILIDALYENMYRSRILERKYFFNNGTLTNIN